jgi:alanyl-tRNA synthetase
MTRPHRLNSSQVRQRFVEYFEKLPQAHTHYRSSPVVPHDDPTLLFANAGMNQFKPCFLGRVEPGSTLDGIKRAVNSQKCIRAGGKHNDLDDVGKDTYHHTFFEMLGNWSFGDYFKADAIGWAYTLLTSPQDQGGFGIDPARLYATYFGGEPAQGLEPDHEARDLWLRHLPAERVLASGMKDNFWEMGETGPCGPCSEIHYDRIGDRDAAGLVNKDDPNVLEIWNLVFIQFDRQADGSLKSLPAKHVDTGMGLERLVSVLQGVTSNYDTDLFLPLFEAIRRETRTQHEYRGKLGAADKDQIDTAYRVVADHLRTLCFAIADGAVPSNDGRGYVLRRVLRRAVRYGRQMLGGQTGFFSRLVPALVSVMGDAWPELAKKQAHIQEVLLEEEESFGKTLDKGLGIFEELAKGGRVSGEDAFKLYDTFGFPVDLTQLMAAERGLSVDVDGFNRCMEEQRERSRAGAKSTETDGLILDPEAIAKLQYKNISPTDDSDKYHGRHMRARVEAIWNGRNFDEHIEGVGINKRVGIVLDKTAFYAESGGQQADRGRLHVSRERRVGDNHGGGEFKVEDVRSFGGFVLHMGMIGRGEIRVGDEVEVQIDHARRLHTASNHTTTHLLNKALRETLGEHVDQKGSLVDHERLRFDFAHKGPMTEEETASVEARVADLIAQDLPVYADLAPQYVARSITGLRAVFGENYPDPVRVVSIGAPVTELLAEPENPRWAELSVEFCGGTHLETTGQAQSFALVSETGVAKGIRRIEAVTGVAAQAACNAANGLESELSRAMSLSPEQMAEAAASLGAQIDQFTLPLPRKVALRAQLSALLERVKTASKAAAGERRAKVESEARSVAESASNSPDPVLVATVDAGDDRQALQAALKLVTDKLPRKAVMLMSVSDDPEKPGVVIIAACPKEMIGRGVKAGDWVRVAAEVVGGKGGGRPEMAQGGGTDTSKLRDSIKTARSWAMKAMGV